MDTAVEDYYSAGDSRGQAALAVLLTAAEPRQPAEKAPLTTAKEGHCCEKLERRIWMSAGLGPLQTGMPQQMTEGTG